jgi:hypothetical protein
MPEQKKAPPGDQPGAGPGEHEHARNYSDAGTGCQSIYPLSLDENTRKKRRAWKWTELNRRRAEDVLQVVKDLYDYRPFTERHLYYRLISTDLTNQAHWRQHNNPDYSKVNVYNVLSPLLKWMRIDDLLPWEVIADETRILTQKVGFDSAKEYVRQELDAFLRYYSRCVAQEQPNHIEVWIEKQTLLRTVEPVADEYCRRVLCCRGYNSMTFQADFYHRTMQAIEQNLRPVVLYFGDWDPSGVNMIHAAMQTIHDELGLDESAIDFYRCGINPEHFGMIYENPDPLPAKPTDSRAKDFIARYGPACYELDALHPRQLQDLVRNSIEAFTDLEVVACNAAIEDREHQWLSRLKTDVQAYVGKKLRQATTFDEGGAI